MSDLAVIAPRLARAHEAAAQRLECPPSGPFTMEPYIGRTWCRGCGRGVSVRFSADVVDVLGRWQDEHVCIDGEREDGR